MKRKAASKRELIAPRGDKRYVRRDAKGRIKESDDVGRSLAQDRRRKAKTAAKSGQGTASANSSAIGAEEHRNAASLWFQFRDGFTAPVASTTAGN